MDRLSPVTDPELLAQLNDDTSESNPEIQSSLKSDYGEDAPGAAVPQRAANPQRPPLKPVTDPELLAQLDEEPAAEAEPFSGISSDPMGDFNPAALAVANSALQRGRQFATGLTESAASVPEGMAITGASLDYKVKTNAPQAIAMRQAQIDNLQGALDANPDMPVQQREWMQAQIAALNEGIQKSEELAVTPIVPARDRDIYKLGDATRDAVKGVIGSPDPNDDSFAGKVATGAGNLTGIVGSSLIASAAGGPWAGIAVGTGVGVTMNQSQVYKEAVEAGVDEDTALRASDWAALVGATDIIPVSRALKLLPQSVRKEVGSAIMKRVIELGQNGAEEGIQEYLQTVGNNIIAQQYYDPERGWTENATESALVGAILGVGVGVIGQARTQVEQVTESGASTEQAAALKSTTPPPPSGTAPVAPAAPKGDIDPAMAQAVAGQPVESPGERAIRVAKERAAAQAAAQQASAAPTADPVTSPGNQPADPPTADAGQEPSATVGDESTAPPPVEAAPATPEASKKSFGDILTKPKNSHHHFLGDFGFSFEANNNGRYLWLTTAKGQKVFQSRDGGTPDTETTHVWGFEDPNQGNNREGPKVGINSLGNNVPPELIPVFRDYLEGKIDAEEATNRIRATELPGAKEAPAPAPVTTEAPAAPAANDNIIERAAAAIQESGVTSPYWLGRMLGVSTNKAGDAMIQLAQNKRLLEFKNNKFRMLKTSNPDANTAQETDATLGEQQKALVEGKRRAVFYPEGTKPAAPPAGSKRTKIEGVGVFDYLPGKITPQEIRSAAKAGRLNELLDLGPYNKQEVAESAAAGATPVAVTERTPGGTEVKAAAGTTETAPVQQEVLEATKAAPDNTVAVEDPREVIAQRAAPVVETRKPRVLKDLSVDSIRAEQEQAEQNEIVADRIKGTLKGPKNKKVFKEEGESTGKNWTKAQRDARAKVETEGQRIAEANPPAENEADFLDPNPGKQTVARAAIRARAEAIVNGAKAAGVSIPDKVAGNTDESMNLGQGGMHLVIARDFLKALSTPYKSVADHYTDFVSRDLRLRNGATSEVISERRTEIDDKMRRGQGGNIEQIADTRETVESDAPDNAAQSLDGRDETLTAEQQAAQEDSATASDKNEKIGNENIVGSDDVETKVSRTAKKTIKTFDEERAAKAEPLKEVSEERAAIEARLRASGYMREDGTFADSTPARPLDKSEIIETYTLADAIAESSAATGNAANRFILNRVLQRLGQKIGKTKVVIVDAETLAEMYPGRNVDGFYDPVAKHIVFSTNFLKNGQFDANLLAHEGLHAYLADAINSDPNLKADIQELLDFVTSKGKFNGARGLVNVHEFISEALSNPEFQNFLMSVEVTGDLAKKYDAPGKKTLWSSLVAAIAKHLGISGGKHLDALSAAIRLAERAEDARSRAVTGRGNQLSEAGTQPIFYSAVQRVVEGIKQGKAAAGQWMGMIKNAPGVKAEELEWLGLKEWLDAQDGAVTRQQVIDFLTANELQITEIENSAGEKSALDELRDAVAAEDNLGFPTTNSAVATLFNNDEGINLDFVPKHIMDLAEKARNATNTGIDGRYYGSMTLPGSKNYKVILITLPGIDGEFTHRHWGTTKNVVAHVRFDERTGPNGEKLLFVNELQSDWHQQGRKAGYIDRRDAGVIRRPRYMIARDISSALREVNYLGQNGATSALNYLVRNRDNAQMLSELPPNIKALAEEYFDALRASEYTNDHVSDAPFKTTWHELVLKRMVRYAAENGFDAVSWPSTPDQIAHIEGWPGVDEVNGRYSLEDKDVTPIIERYTTDLPRSANKLFKKFDAKTQLIDLPMDVGDPQKAFSLPITPSMRDSVLQGQPLFRERNFSDELRAAGVPDDIASELHDVLTNDLKDVDADTLAFVMEDLKTKYGTSGSNGPTADQVNADAAKQGEKITKAAEELEAAFVPSKNPGRRRGLWAASNYQIGQMADDYFGKYGNPLRKVAELIERRRVRKAEILDELGEVVDKLADAERRYSINPQTRADWQNFTSLMNDATMAEVHPDRPLDQQKHLGTDAMRFKWAKAQYPELASRYRSLPPDLMKLWQETRDAYTDTQNRMNLGRLTNLLKAAGHEDAALVKRFFDKKATEADKKLIGPRVAEMIDDTVELSKVEGPYFPLGRRGDWRVQGIYKIEKPKNARALSDNEFEFKTRDEAIAYAEKQQTKPTIKQVYVDKTTGEMFGKDKDGTEVKISKNDADAEPRWRVVVQNRHVEFASSQKEAQKIADELRADGLQVDDVMKRTNNLPNGANADMLSEQMKQLAATLKSRKAFSDLSETQRKELEEVLHEVSLRYLGSTRIQSHLIRRRNIEGASTDAVRNALDYANSASGYMARLEVQPDVDAAFKDADKRLASLSKQGTGAAAGASELVRALKERAVTANVEEGNGTVSVAIRRLTQLAFLRYLASPAYSFFNAMQPHLVALPVLAAEYGEARASAEFFKAYYDLGMGRMIGTGVADTVKAFAGNEGTDHLKVALTKLKNPKERALLEELRKIGFIDSDAGMMVARHLAHPDTFFGKTYDPVMAFIDNIGRQAPKAVEALNRSVVALTAYRLAMRKHGKHEQAVQDAKDAVDNTQGTYSQSNQAPAFRHPLGRISLQFKKYGQMMYYNLGRQAGRIIRGMKPGDRKAGFKALAYTLATHQIAAGTMGLPWEPAKIFLSVLNGLGFVDYDWEDLKEDVEAFYASLVGEKGGEMLTSGVSRGLGPVAFDMSTRVGLDSLLTFGSPKSYDDSDVQAYLWEMISGASGSNIKSWAKAVRSATNGDWDKFLDALPLKFAVDVGKAVKKGSEGDYTLPEAILKGAGVTPASQARAQTKENQQFKQERRVKDEYNELFYGYIDAGNDMAKVAKLTSRIREWNARQAKLPKSQRGQKIRIETVEKRRREELRKREKNKSGNE